MNDELLLPRSSVFKLCHCTPQRRDDMALMLWQTSTPYFVLCHQDSLALHLQTIINRTQLARSFSFGGAAFGRCER